MSHWNLLDVHRLIKEKNYWFSCYSRSIKEVIRVFQATSTPKNNEEAEQYILSKLASLSPSNFAHTEFVFGQRCDVYGEYFDDVPWYIKFTLKDDEGNECLNNLSFHPPEEPLKTASKEITTWKQK